MKKPHSVSNLAGVASLILGWGIDKSNESLTLRFEAFPFLRFL